MFHKIRSNWLQAANDFLRKLDEGNSPRWVIYLLDLTIIEFSMIFAFLLRFNFHLGQIEKEWLLYSMGFILLIRGSFALMFKTYSHVIRYTSSKDIARLLAAVSLGSATLMAVSISLRSLIPFTVIPVSVIIIESFLSIYLLTNMRLALKYIYRRSISPLKESNNVLIIGSKEKAILTREAIEIDRTQRNRVIAFIDESSAINKNRLAGIPFLSIRKVEELIAKNRIQMIILAKENLPEKIKLRIATICKDFDIKLLYAPDNWIRSDSPKIEMREVNIEELLTRDPINLDKKHLHNYIKGKSILVTGAAGSIGSELVRQIVRYNPKHIVLLDQAETALYDIELDLQENYNFRNYTIILADILQKTRIEKIFDVFRPEILYHAAAYKHVPMLENNPIEAFINNVEGTVILSDLANKYNCQKMVMISTDKAVNPTGVMGATKRMAEMYVQSMNEVTDTAFVTTRFGNVLNSSGSAIPRFIKQINDGGPVTVTHPEITRYFMTIREACQLVLEASVMGNGGEIYLFDMGKAVKIDDLARRLIKLTGHSEQEIQIKYTGLREGEKLFEELLLMSEPNRPTHHPKIMIGEVSVPSYHDIRNQIADIAINAKLQDVMSVVKKMKQMIPTYKSKNSIFQQLDVR